MAVAPLTEKEILSIPLASLLVGSPALQPLSESYETYDEFLQAICPLERAELIANLAKRLNEEQGREVAGEDPSDLRAWLGDEHRPLQAELLQVPCGCCGCKAPLTPSSKNSEEVGCCECQQEEATYVCGGRRKHQVCATCYNRKARATPRPGVKDGFVELVVRFVHSTNAQKDELRPNCVVLISRPGSFSSPTLEGSFFGLVQKDWGAKIRILPEREGLVQAGVAYEIRFLSCVVQALRRGNALAGAWKPSEYLQRLLIGQESPAMLQPEMPLPPNLTELNPQQAQAVSRCWATEGFSLVHGPPGTGKTLVGVELLLHAVMMDPDARTLASAFANGPVRDLLRKYLRRVQQMKDVIKEPFQDITWHPGSVVEVPFDYNDDESKCHVNHRSYRICNILLPLIFHPERREWGFDRSPGLSLHAQVLRKKLDMVKLGEVQDPRAEVEEELEFFKTEGPRLAEELTGSLTSRLERGDGTLYQICQDVSTGLLALADAAEAALNSLDPSAWTSAPRRRNANGTGLPEALRKVSTPLTKLQSALQAGERLVNAGSPPQRLAYEEAKLNGERREAAVAGEERWDDWDEKQFRGNRFVKELACGARLVFMTLIVSGNETQKFRGMGFKYVLVDEACQMVEADLLLPLSENTRKVWLVGDPQQLPSVLMSQAAVAANYNQPTFVRLQKMGIPTHFLSQQYRCRPLLTQIVNKVVYNDSLVDAQSVLEREAEEARQGLSPPSNFPALELIPTNAHGFCEFKEGTSRENRPEAKMVVERLRQFLKSEYFGRRWGAGRKVSIAVITFYAAQKKLLVDMLREACEKEEIDPALQDCIVIDTVDAFQGRECDIVIISTVLANREKDLRFVKDLRRTNVALSRARDFLWIFGHTEVLSCPRSPHSTEYESAALWEHALKLCLAHEAELKKAHRMNLQAEKEAFFELLAPLVNQRLATIGADPNVRKELGRSRLTLADRIKEITRLTIVGEGARATLQFAKNATSNANGNTRARRA